MHPGTSSPVPVLTAASRSGLHNSRTLGSLYSGCLSPFQDIIEGPYMAFRGHLRVPLQLLVVRFKGCQLMHWMLECAA
jgi:hypothetical protein